MEILKFAEPQFSWGYNVTVRLGTKWAERVKAGDVVGLCDLGGTEPLYTAIIRAVRVCLVRNITLAELANEHDSESQLPGGLCRMLTKVYGREVGWNDIVTVVTFEISDEEDPPHGRRE